jgi:hypothetical protein|tara:strand:+ start:719 stop:1141 length:423 start_codon:yes stop_codon:yes gene_type:complete
MPGLGIGLAAVTCEAVGGSYSGVELADTFWVIGVAMGSDGGGGAPFLSGDSRAPLAIGATSLSNGTAIDDLPDNTQWDLIDIGDGSGAVHYTPEDTSSIATQFPKYLYAWIVGRADGGDPTDTGYLRPTGTDCSAGDSNC